MKQEITGFIVESIQTTDQKGRQTKKLVNTMKTTINNLLFRGKLYGLITLLAVMFLFANGVNSIIILLFFPKWLLGLLIIHSLLTIYLLKNVIGGAKASLIETMESVPETLHAAQHTHNNHNNHSKTAKKVTSRYNYSIIILFMILLGIYGWIGYYIASVSQIVR